MAADTGIDLTGWGWGWTLSRGGERK